MKRCAIYSRVACVEQNGDERAFAAQEAAGIELCRKKGWRFEVFRETGTPGTVLRKLVELAKVGRINYVLVNSWDRLSRNVQQLMTVKEEIERGGAMIVTVPGRRQIITAPDALLEEMTEEMTAMFRRVHYSCMAQRRRWALARRRNRR